MRRGKGLRLRSHITAQEKNFFLMGDILRMKDAREGRTLKTQTALITGPTSGIGKQLAIQLAKKGYDQVLVSRNEEKLIELSEQLTNKYGIQTHHIVADLANPDSIEKIFQETKMKGLEIDVLVNNAGFDVYAPFAESDWQANERLLTVNVKAVLDLTHRFLPLMVQRKQGHILNIGSIGSFIPGPNNAVYAAGKAFILSFSEAIAEELRGSGVGVTCLCPGAVSTAFADKADVKNTPLFIYTAMDPEAVAVAGVRAMEKKKRVYVPGWINKIFIFLYRFFPRSWVTRISKWAMARQGT